MNESHALAHLSALEQHERTATMDDLVDAADAGQRIHWRMTREAVDELSTETYQHRMARYAARRAEYRAKYGRERK